MAWGWKLEFRFPFRTGVGIGVEFDSNTKRHRLRLRSDSSHGTVRSTFELLLFSPMYLHFVCVNERDSTYTYTTYLCLLIC
jgi:hypothetical protein